MSLNSRELAPRLFIAFVFRGTREGTKLLVNDGTVAEAELESES